MDGGPRRHGSKRVINMTMGTRRGSHTKAGEEGGGGYVGWYKDKLKSAGKL